MHLIKRYSNRKLYDTISKTYITLDTIATIVREGEKIEVIENDSGENITAAILAQIIAEDARKTNSYSPSIFVQMIRKSGDFMWGSAKKIAQTVGETAYSLEEQIETRIKKITTEQPEEISEENVPLPSTYRKIEEQMEIWMVGILQRLNIPTKNDLKKLQKAIDALEQRLQQFSTKSLTMISEEKQIEIIPSSAENTISQNSPTQNDLEKKDSSSQSDLEKKNSSHLENGQTK